MTEKVKLAEKFALLEKPYEPGIVGYINDYMLQVVKAKGPFVWHKHDETDDFFLVISGHLTIHLRDRDVELDAGELFVVPRGVEHCPDAKDDTEVLLIEPKGTVNTGDVGGDMTVKPRLLLGSVREHGFGVRVDLDQAAWEERAADRAPSAKTPAAIQNATV